MFVPSWMSVSAKETEQNEQVIIALDGIKGLSSQKLNTKK